MWLLLVSAFLTGTNSGIAGSATRSPPDDWVFAPSDEQDGWWRLLPHAEGTVIDTANS
jgi:hypothetical protein